MNRGKRPADPRLGYPRVMEASLVVALLLVTSVFITSKEFAVSVEPSRFEKVVIKVEDIPITYQIKRPPPPARPTIPIEIEEPGIEGELTIPEPVDWKDLLPPPLPVDGDDVIYIAVEKPPKLIGGEEAILKYILEHRLFPEMALKAGVGGMCTIQFVVDETGRPTDIFVKDENPRGLGFGEAGVKAISAMTFTPGQQRDRLVKVHMEQTIHFRLK